jgi:hypothetical protein
MLTHILLISSLLLGFLYWFNAMKVKEIALKATQAHCQKMEVQMLDDYIASDGIRLVRDKAGRRQWQRRFSFEFSSTGEKRYHGKITLLGQRVETIEMEPHQIEWVGFIDATRH